MSAPQIDGPPPGLRVGGYELLARLGEGGMGVVHLARKPGGERVALKVLRPHIVGDDEARHRLAREVSSLSRIRSRRVAEIVDADPWGDVPFVATRYVPGLSLHDHVHEEGPVVGDDLVWLAECLGEALAAVHAVGVLHRDVKPSNVLMEGRTPILIDFGLARVADDPRLTHTGWLLGTPGYLAPEILHGEDATPASDVHSWAATVAFAALGRAPFGRGPAMAIMDRVRRGEHDLAGVDPRLEALLERCLDPDPRRRPTLPDVRHHVEAALPVRRASSGGASGPVTVPLAAAALAHRQQPTEVGGHEVGDDQDYDRYADLFARDEPAPAPADREDTAVLPREQRTFFDDWEDDGWVAEPSPRPRAVERLRRGTLTLAGVAAAGAGIALAPYVTVAVLVALVWLLRSGSLAGSAAGRRRELRGRKWYDAPQLLVATPLHLVASIPGLLLLVLWSVGVAAAAALLCYAAAAPFTLGLGLSGAAFALGLWWGPGSSRLRGPVSRVAHPVAARPVVWFLVMAALLGAAGGIAALAMDGTSWFPADARPLAGLDLPAIPVWLRP